ncbi:DUF1302 domain-containing protein [Paucibacter sp. JuS9]|uniref:DUF1302 domain-containing protein n=1 Tax=Roseateles TaxID=93681 RepID=UPI002FE62684
MLSRIVPTAHGRAVVHANATIDKDLVNEEKNMGQRQTTPSHRRLRRSLPGLAAAALCCGATLAQAASIETGNADLTINWDHTLRYNLGQRLQKADAAILGNANADDGDRNFAKGSIVTNRIDVLSEFDVTWKRRAGLRLSAAGWYDAAYRSLDNTSTASANTLQGGLPVAGQLSTYTQRFGKGFSGEMLDWFLFANLKAGDMPLNVRLGQHTAYWGEGLLLGGLLHGIAYGQNSVDAWKLQATPGAEAKEFIRPRGALSLQMQPTQDLSLAAQWFYNWQAVRSPESGSYLSGTDMLVFGGDSLITGPNPFAALIPGAPAALRMWNAQAIKPSSYGNRHDYGVSARWNPAWLDGTAGLYFRNSTDVLPQLMLMPGVATVPAATCTALGGTALAPTTCLVNTAATTVADLQKYGKAGLYRTSYGKDIQMLAVSLSKNIAGVSVGAELSQRRNMPLVSDAVTVLPAALTASTAGAIATTAIPANGDAPGARGTTWHGLVNGTYVVPSTPLFDTASIAAELTWMQVSEVTQNAAVYKGRDAYTAIDKPSKRYWGLAINFSPTWYQVLPGVDLSAPISWNQGIGGNAATTFGGNRGAGSWSLGLAATLQQAYTANLSYLRYYGDYSTNPANGAATVFNGSSASISDRGWISLTLKASF